MTRDLFGQASDWFSALTFSHGTMRETSFTTTTMMGPRCRMNAVFVLVVLAIATSFRCVHAQAAPKRINCGGDRLVDRNGNMWMEDIYYQGGKTFKTDKSISSSLDDELLQTERFGRMQYNIPVTPGVYDVRLQWSENFDLKPDKRVFHVIVEDVLAFQNLDIYKEAGNRGYRRITKTHRANAVGGYINIEFVPEKGEPKIGTIEIVPVQNKRAPHPDIRAVVPVKGDKPQGDGNPWADSYSVGDKCYCDKVTTYDHNIGEVVVETPLGWMTVKQACELIGPGPGKNGNPIYNDVQCGNGPPNDQGDEQRCPGRVDLGIEGCGHIGPKWNFGVSRDGGDKASSLLPVTPNRPSGMKNRFVLNAGGKDDDGKLVDKGLTGRTWKYNRAGASIKKNGKIPRYYFKSHRSAEQQVVYKITGFDKTKLYKIMLGFAEIYSPNCRKNARILSIRVNDRAYVKEMDVFSEAGCESALIKTYVQRPDSKGEFNIVIGAKQDRPAVDKNAMISFIEIVKP